MVSHPAGTVFATPSLSGEPVGVAVSPSGDVLVARILGSVVSRYQLPDTLPSANLDAGREPVHVAINGAGTHAYVVRQGGQYLLDLTLSPFGITDSLPLTNSGINVAVKPGDGRVYVTTSDGRLYVVATASMALVDSMRVGGTPNGLAFSRDGSRLYISSRDAGTITVFSTQSDAQIGKVVTGNSPQRLAVSSDDATLFVATEYSGVEVISLPSLDLQPPILLDSSAYGLGLTPDGMQIYATSPTRGLIFIIDVATGRAIDTLTVGGVPRDVAFDHEGKTAIVTDGNGRVIFIH